MASEDRFGEVACPRGCGSFDPATDRHDCAYVRRVNELVEVASEEADAASERFQATLGDKVAFLAGELHRVWDRAFHAAMARLTVAAGLRRPAAHAPAYRN